MSEIIPRNNYLGLCHCIAEKSVFSPKMTQFMANTEPKSHTNTITSEAAWRCFKHHQIMAIRYSEKHAPPHFMLSYWQYINTFP